MPPVTLGLMGGMYPALLDQPTAALPTVALSIDTGVNSIYATLLQL